MNRGAFVTGTDTGVGKTLVASALIQGFATPGPGRRRLQTGGRRCRMP